MIHVCVETEIAIVREQQLLCGRELDVWQVYPRTIASRQASSDEPLGSTQLDEGASSGGQRVRPGIIHSGGERQRRGLADAATALGDIHLDDTTEDVGPMEDGGKAPEQPDRASCRQRNQRQVRAMVPPERQRHTVHDDRDLAVLSSSERRLSLTPRIPTDLDERHLPEKVLRRGGWDDAHGIQADLDGADTPGVSQGARDCDPHTLDDKRVRRRAYGVWPDLSRYIHTSLHDGQSTQQ